MVPRIDAEVSESVWRALEERTQRSGAPVSRLVDDLLANALGLDRHSLFQISTSNALIQGVFGGIATVADLKRHGDFGLGTFEGLDGEMILLDGECFRAGPGGEVTVVSDDRATPFALVTRFHSDVEAHLDGGSDLPGLLAEVDGLRPSDNLFVGIRGHGRFGSVLMRVACQALPGEGLLAATHHQSEFATGEVSGTLVGFWAPEYTRSVSVPGYHIHFLADDRSTGGHVLGLSTADVRVDLHTESELHLAIPETEEFLTADLAGDHADELSLAETDRR